MVTPTKKLLRSMADVWAPRERLTAPEWCERELRLPAESGPNPGRFDLSRFPYMRGILEAADDPETEELIMVGATQWGKTTTLQAIVASNAKLRPSPVMICAPDMLALKKLRNKFYGMCDASPALRGKVPPKHLRNMESIDFGDSLCHLAFTGNPQRMSGESCRMVLMTEVDRSRRQIHEGAFHKILKERVKAWFNYLVVYEGTPTDDTSVIWDLYQASDKRKWHVPCPHCGTYQEMRFFRHSEGPHKGRGGISGLQDPEGNWYTSDEVYDHVHYVCIESCRIESAEKNEMAARGIWVPEGQTAEKNGTLSGKPKRSGRRKGFHMSSLPVDTISLGRIAAEYLDSRDHEEELRNFLNNWVGLRYTLRTKVPKWTRLGRRLRGAHRPGTVPPQALFLTAGIDVQEDCTYWIVRAWGEDGTSWLVDWGRCEKTTDEHGKVLQDSHLTRLEGLVLEREFPCITANPLGQETLPIARAAIDCGYRTRLVHDWALKQRGGRVITVAGDDAVPKGLPYRFSIVEKSTRTGKAYPGGLRRWALNVSDYKTDIQDRWAAPLDRPGAWWLTNAPLEDAEPYLRQVVNEARVQKRMPSGHIKEVWCIVDPRVGNHDFDCEVYAMAAADMVVEGVWSNLTERLRTGRNQDGGARQQEGRKGGFVRARQGFVRRKR